MGGVQLPSPGRFPLRLEARLDTLRDRLLGVSAWRAFPLQGRATDRKARPYTHTNIHTTNHLGFVPVHTDTHTYSCAYTRVCVHRYVQQNAGATCSVVVHCLWKTLLRKPGCTCVGGPVTNQAFLPRAQLDPSITSSILKPNPRPGITANRSRREECMW